MADLMPGRSKANIVKSEFWALYLAAKDPRTPMAAKVIAVLAVLYALSPVDLIPEYIPLAGLLDDLIILPLGLWLAMRMVPPEVLRDVEQKAGSIANGLKKLMWSILAVLITFWVVAALLVLLLIKRIAGQ